MLCSCRNVFTNVSVLVLYMGKSIQKVEDRYLSLNCPVVEEVFPALLIVIIKTNDHINWHNADSACV